MVKKLIVALAFSNELSDLRTEHPGGYECLFVLVRRVRNVLFVALAYYYYLFAAHLLLKTKPAGCN